MRCRLSDVCDLVAGYAFKSKDFGDYKDKVIKITHISPPRVDMEHLEGIDITAYNRESLRKYIAHKGDYLLAMTGATIGKLGRITNGSAYVNQRVLLFRPKEDVSKDFLYYVLCQHHFMSYVRNYVDSESAQANISANTIGKYKIELPPLDTQHKIASVLSSLDDKIELNDRINANLEEQAKAIFKSWFVDFEPFGGKVPEDWHPTQFREILTPVSDKSDDESIPMFSVTDTGLYPRSEKFKKNLTMKNAKGKIIRENDLVFGMSREILNWGVMHAPVGMVSSAYNVYHIREDVDSFYLEGYMKAHIGYFKDLIRPASREGQGIDRGILMGKEIYLPPKTVAENYYKIEDSITRMSSHVQDENLRLSSIRDALLPRLLSGELDVSNLTI